MRAMTAENIHSFSVEEWIGANKFSVGKVYCYLLSSCCFVTAERENLKKKLSVINRRHCDSDDIVPISVLVKYFNTLIFSSVYFMATFQALYESDLDSCLYTFKIIFILNHFEQWSYLE